MTDRLGTIDKKPDSGAHPAAVDDAGSERRYLEERFSVDPKRLTAARQDRERGALGAKIEDRAGDRIQHMFSIVEQKNRPRLLRMIDD